MEIEKSTLESDVDRTAFNLASTNFPPQSLSSGERSGSFVFAEQISQKRSASSIARLHADGIANDANQVIGNVHGKVFSETTYQAGVI